MSPETKTCQNCKQNFTIESEDFDFYKKIDVPPPTFCWQCRIQRRLLFRNERTLYKIECALCKNSMISMYSKESSFPIYCRSCWFSDAWDPLSYGRDYDFNQTFFEQLHELLRIVPRFNLFQRNSLNSEYTNIITDVKDSYLSYSLTKNAEVIYYSRNIDASRLLFDCLNTTNSENCYEDINGDHNYRSTFMIQSRNCLDSHFLYDCVNCNNCALSANLRNQQYVFMNRKLGKEAYKKEIEDLKMNTYEGQKTAKKQFKDLYNRALHKYMVMANITNSSGDNLMNTKNAYCSFDAHECDDVRYVFRCWGLKDSMDTNNTGLTSELIYEYTSGGKASQRVKFSLNGLEALNHAEYTDNCGPGSNLFACVGLRNKEYCILNKQYGKNEYIELVSRIKKQMNAMPYRDELGREYRYGEFMPYNLSPFAYNETTAHEFLPLKQEEATQKGYRWKSFDAKQYVVDRRADQISETPDDSIVEKTIGCLHENACNEQCTSAFKITPQEIQFYQQMQLPLPRLCPNCRYYERLPLKNPMKLWHRTCACAGTQSDTGVWKNTANHFHGANHCPNEFETSYAPERPEVVYCEQCYNSEIV